MKISSGMRILIGALAVALLAGCTSSPAELRSEGPAASFKSAKAVEEVSQCVLFAWQGQSLYGVRYDAYLQPAPHAGKTVITQGQVEMADISAAASGTKVDFYIQGGMMDWRKNRRIEALKQCL